MTIVKTRWLYYSYARYLVCSTVFPDIFARLLPYNVTFFISESSKSIVGLQFLKMIYLFFL